MSIQNLAANWKTTAAGCGMIVGALTHLGFAIKNGTLSETMVTSEIMAAITGMGLLMAGDASKSSKDLSDVNDKVDRTAQAVVTGNTEILTKPPEAPKV